MTPFSWFCEFAFPIEKKTLLRENRYERGIRFGRECVCVGVRVLCVCVCVGGGGGGQRIGYDA